MRVTVELTEREMTWLRTTGRQRTGQLHLLESCEPACDWHRIDPEEGE